MKTRSTGAQSQDLFQEEEDEIRVQETIRELDEEEDNEMDQRLENITQQLTVLAEAVAALQPQPVAATPPQDPWEALRPDNNSGIEPPEDDEVLKLFQTLRTNKASLKFRNRDVHDVEFVLSVAADWGNLTPATKRATYNRGRLLLAVATMGWPDALRLAPGVPTDLLRLPAGFTPSQQLPPAPAPAQPFTGPWKGPPPGQQPFRQAPRRGGAQRRGRGQQR